MYKSHNPKQQAGNNRTRTYKSAQPLLFIKPFDIYRKYYLIHKNKKNYYPEMLTQNFSNEDFLTAQSNTY